MTTLYVDASRPDDSGNGTSPGTAKKTIRGARLAMGSDKNVLFIKSGQHHDPVSGKFMDLTVPGQFGMDVLSYGDGNLPVWDSLTYNVEGAGGWTYVSDGVWKRVAGAWYCRRMFAGARNTGFLSGHRYPGTPLRRAPVSGATSAAQNVAESTIIASLSAAYPWAPGGATTSFAIYVYTGSALLSPDVFYSGLSWIQADGASVGAVWPIQIKSTQNVLIRGQEFWSSGDACVRVNCANADSLDTSDIEVTQCNFRFVYGIGVCTRGLTELSPTRYIRNVSISRNLIDSNTSAAEQELSLGETALSGSGDFIQVEQRSINVSVYRNTIVNPGHAGLVIGTSFSNDAPQGCSAVRNTIRFSEWVAYGRGAAVYNGTGHRITGNEFIGQNVRSQFAGSVLVSNNVWTGGRQSIRKPGTDQVFACESYYYDNGSGLGNAVRYVNITPVAVTLEGNTCSSVASTEILALNSYGNAFPVGGTTWTQGALSIRSNDFSGCASSALLRAADGGGNAPLVPNEEIRDNKSTASMSYKNSTSYGVNVLANSTGNSPTASGSSRLSRNRSINGQRRMTDVVSGASTFVTVTSK